MASIGLHNRLVLLATTLAGANEHGWARDVMAALNWLIGSRTIVIQDRHGLLDECPAEIREGLLAWVDDPEPRLDGLRFRIREMGPSFNQLSTSVGIELIYPFPDGRLLIEGFDVSRILYFYYPGCDMSEEIDRRRRTLFHILDTAHSRLVQQLRSRPKQEWPNRTARIVRWLGQATFLVS